VRRRELRFGAKARGGAEARTRKERRAGNAGPPTHQLRALNRVRVVQQKIPQKVNGVRGLLCHQRNAVRGWKIGVSNNKSEWRRSANVRMVRGRTARP
jgi:hypothetical protein